MNYFEEIRKHIKFYSDRSHSEKESSEYNLLLHLIVLMGEKDFNVKFTIGFMNRDDVDFDERFHDFHKSMRQTDFYNELYIRNKRDISKTNNPAGGSIYDYENVGGSVDMIFWNFICISDAPYMIFKTFHKETKNFII